MRRGRCSCQSAPVSTSCQDMTSPGNTLRAIQIGLCKPSSSVGRGLFALADSIKKWVKQALAMYDSHDQDGVIGDSIDEAIAIDETLSNARIA